MKRMTLNMDAVEKLFYEIADFDGDGNYYVASNFALTSLRFYSPISFGEYLWENYLSFYSRVYYYDYEDFLDDFTMTQYAIKKEFGVWVYSNLLNKPYWKGE